MDTKDRIAARKRYSIRAVERALTLLKAFLCSDAELGASEIRSRVHLDSSTTFRMLVTLEGQGFVRHDPVTGKYRLGVACLELGSQFLRTNDLRKSALPVMDSLRNEFGETVHLGMLEGDQIVWLEKLPGLHAIGLMSSRVGGRAPAHSTATGKVLLSHLSPREFQECLPQQRLARCTEFTLTDRRALQAELMQVRERRYAIDNQENEMGVKCVAVPIFGHKGIVAALSVSGPVERMEEHIAKHRLIERLQQAMTEISAEMGWGRGVDQIGEPGVTFLSPNQRESRRSTAAKTAKTI